MPTSCVSSPIAASTARKKEDGAIYLDRGDREIAFPSGTPFEAWVAQAVEFFELDDAYDLLRDPKGED